MTMTLISFTEVENFIQDCDSLDTIKTLDSLIGVRLDELQEEADLDDDEEDDEDFDDDDSDLDDEDDYDDEDEDDFDDEE